MCKFRQMLHERCQWGSDVTSWEILSLWLPWWIDAIEWRTTTTQHTPYHTILHYTTPHHTIPITLHYTTPHHTIPITPHYFTLHHTTSHHTTHHTTPHHTTPHYTTLHYVYILHYHDTWCYNTKHDAIQYTTIHYTIQYPTLWGWLQTDIVFNQVSGLNSRWDDTTVTSS